MMGLSRSMEDCHADETAIPYEYCARCNNSEQGFTPQGGNPDIPICNICGYEATRVTGDESMFRALQEFIKGRPLGEIMAHDSTEKYFELRKKLKGI